MKTTEQQLVIVNLEKKDIDQLYEIYINPHVEQCLYSLLLFADEKKSLGLDLDKRYSYKNRDKIFLQLYCSDGTGKVVGSISSKLEANLPESRLAEALDQLIGSNRAFFDRLNLVFGYEFLIRIIANIGTNDVVANQNDINSLFDGDATMSDIGNLFGDDGNTDGNNGNG